MKEQITLIILIFILMLFPVFMLQCAMKSKGGGGRSATDVARHETIREMRKRDTALPMSATSNAMAVPNQGKASEDASQTAWEMQDTKVVAFVPGIVPVTNAVLADIVASIGTFVEEGNRILRSGNYQAHTHNGSTWLRHEDRQAKQVWTFYRTSTEVQSYSDNELMQGVSIVRLVVNPTTGELVSFADHQNEEFLFVRPDEKYPVKYSKPLTEKTGMELRWDKDGGLISSNIYYRGKSGGVIGYGDPPPSALFGQ